jgi:hypothetical protein
MCAGSWLWSLIDLQTFHWTATAPIGGWKMPAETGTEQICPPSCYGLRVGIPVPGARCQYGPHLCGGD